jgi:hypothetical protein
MPVSLHRQLAEQAKKEKTSLNSWIIHLLNGKNIIASLQECQTKCALNAEKLSNVLKYDYVDLNPTNSHLNYIGFNNVNAG